MSGAVRRKEPDLWRVMSLVFEKRATAIGRLALSLRFPANRVEVRKNSSSLGNTITRVEIHHCGARE
jgi:hypothetical protein